MYYAHSGPTREAWEPLADHLRDVAERAALFAGVFGAAEEARFAGLLHDLGKYSDLFTLRLSEKVHHLDHWSAGAFEALNSSAAFGIAAALAIQGHHIGLQFSDSNSLKGLQPERLMARHPLGLKLTESDPTKLLERLAADGIELPRLARSMYDFRRARETPGASMLAVRMLFSALVDADFLETAAHFDRDALGKKRHRPESPALAAGRALQLVTRHLQELSSTSTAAPSVTGVRADLLDACLAAAEQPPGVFTLTAPTGSGKTLAMLAFALRHAERHGLRRVVMAIPFLSILEQTAKVYRDILEPELGAGYLLEHHSLANLRTEPGDASTPAGDSDLQQEPLLRARWLTENWDAPLVVTTSVQLLESLFANRPAACRKLHRLAGSVILLDEVQTLPPQLAVPTLGALSHLAERFGASVVFATASQPAFDALDPEVRKLTTAGWRPTPIVPKELALFERTRRVRVTWRVGNAITWDALAEEIAESPRILVVVNLKRHAHALANALKNRGVAGLFHLSTNMCPAHRQSVLQKVRDRLASPDAPCILVSTQCIEAGVDIDFPKVYRALAPLDAIAQAAGRCNRNGRLADLGELIVFLPADDKALYPPGAYAKAAEVTKLLLKRHSEEGLDLQSAEIFREYYETFYALTGITDLDRESKELWEALRVGDFVDVANRYRLIQQDVINVLVPYDLEAYAALRADLAAQNRLTGAWIQRARPHTISLYRPARDAVVRHFLQPAPLGRNREGKNAESEDWFVYLDPDHYNPDLGLTAAEINWIA